LESDVATELPFVSIIVPCRNERRYIAGCLDSIVRNDYPHERLEVLVVDGCSDDGTAEEVDRYAQRFPLLRRLPNPGRTTPKGLNIGVRAARGEVIVRMDVHCTYPESYVRSLIGWLTASGADNVGGVCRTIPGAGSARALAVALALAHPFGVGNAQFRLGVSEPTWADTVPFGCYRRDVFDRIGFFDEELVRNQDDEFNHRLIARGGRILLVPDVVIEYYARATWAKTARMYYQYGYFKPLVVRKLGRVMTFRQLIPPVFVLAIALGMLLAPAMDWARLALLSGMSAYVSLALGFGINAARACGPGVALCLAATFPVLHFAYGTGFMAGLADLVRGRHLGTLRAGVTSSR
jgi:glycosyltransferase involved in cell wall biosynthesis